MDKPVRDTTAGPSYSTLTGSQASLTRRTREAARQRYFVSARVLWYVHSLRPAILTLTSLCVGRLPISRYATPEFLSRRQVLLGAQCAYAGTSRRRYAVLLRSPASGADGNDAESETSGLHLE